MNKDPRNSMLPGLGLVESTRVSRGALDFLFAALLATSFASFVFGNLLLLDPAVLLRTAPIAGVSLGVICLFYAAARFLGGLAPAAIVLCAGAWALVYLQQPWLVWPCYALAVFAAVYTVTSLRVAKSEIPPVLLLGALGAAVAFSSGWLNSVFDMFGSVESGSPAKDTLFHAALAAMIKNYGVVSTGLNGLVETPYYVMTHYVVAAVSTLSGRGVVEVIGPVNLTLFIPLLPFALASVVASLSPGAPNGLLARVWLFSCFSLVVFPFFLERWHLSAYCFASESYVLSIALLLFAVPAFFLRRLSWSVVASIIALTVFLSYTKISTALFIPGLAFLRLLLPGTQAKPRDVTLLLGAGCVVLYFLFAVVKTAESGGMHGFGLSRVLETIPFGSAWTSVAESWRGGGALAVATMLLAGVALLLYAFFHFVVSWCVLGVTASQGAGRALWRNPLFVYVAGSALAGLVLSCVYYDDNNIGTYYFSHPAFFLALPFFAVWLSGFSWWGVRLGAMAVVVGVIIAALSAGSYYKYSRWAPLRTVDPVCASVVYELRELRHSAPLDVTLLAAPGVAELPLVKSQSTRPRLKPTAQPFLFPAVSERPWTDVTGPRGTNSSENYISYSFISYNMDRETGQMLSEPVLLEGMSIKEWAGAGMPR